MVRTGKTQRIGKRIVDALLPGQVAKMRVSVLDREVAAARARENGDEDGLGLFQPEPWPDAVKGDDLLNRLADVLRHYVVMPVHAAEVVALWAVHCHAPEIWRHPPRLSITAPEKGCGKSTLLDALAYLVPRPIKTENLSTAVPLRAVDEFRPTLLIDEFDTFLRDNQELRGCLDAGHAQGGKHLRCEGDSNDVRAFKTFAPVALAGIGSLPATLADRAIPIFLQNRKADEFVPDLRKNRVEHLRELASQIARWLQDHESTLRGIDPVMSQGIHNRLEDNWRPLLAIADVVGGDWSERLRSAAISIFGTANDDDETNGVRLLADIRRISEEREED
jgi:putative DNA primase/helicase